MSLDTNMPLISIVLPVYKTEKLLPDALDSLVDQTYKNLEIIVVNNGSTDKVTCIFEEYREAYPEFQWVLLTLKENIGLFHARMKGFEVANGAYFTTMDSDDKVSTDFYFQLINRALTASADIVVGGYVHNFGEHGMRNYPMNEFDRCDFCWEGEEILDRFFEACGRTFNYHALWCKIYERGIWERSKDAIFSIVKEHIVLSEDILATTIFFSNAKRLVNVHDVYYYHAVHDHAATAINSPDIKKDYQSIDDQFNSFTYIKEYLVSIHKFSRYEKNYLKYRDNFVTVILEIIKNSGINESEKKICENYVCKKFGYTKPPVFNFRNFLSECRTSTFNNELETTLQIISDKRIEVISFDIFDTLIERPFARPDDVFEFLSIEYNSYKQNPKYIDFARIRRNAEATARQKLMDHMPFHFEVNIDEIYEELVRSEMLTEKEAVMLKQKEISLEYRFCKARRIGKYLYDFALRCGKKVICISDMYLPESVISKILMQNGYDRISGIYVSSSERVCKYDGKLFKKVLDDLNIAAQDICHIGDSYVSDYLAPEKLGIKHCYLASAQEVFKGKNGLSFSGASFPYIIGDKNDKTGPYGYLGTRCMYGVAANKVFGNPFVHFDESSDFNSDPNIIGYYLMGTYIFTVAKWLMDQTCDRYETIHFVARDGYVVKQAYDILAAHTKRNAPKSNYLHVSRKSLMPMMIHTPDDLHAIVSFVDYQGYSPESFLNLMKEIIPEKAFVERERILRENHINAGAKFENENQWNEFIRVYRHNFFSEVQIDAYSKKMQGAFEKIIGPSDCTFDMGYSLRNETLLYELLGRKLDAFYLYSNEEKANRQSRCLDIKLTVFNEEAATTTDFAVVERLISDTQDGCVGYNVDGGNLETICEKNNIDTDSVFYINLLQTRAVEFVSDYVQVFPEWENLSYRYTDRPLKYYFYHAKDFDKGILFKLKNKDDLSSYGQGEYVIDLWQTTAANGNQLLYATPIGVKGALINYFRKHTPRWLTPFAKRVKKILNW